jgi:hypothetical protein
MLQHVTDKRIAYVPKTETLVITNNFPYIAILSEVPDLAAGITITGLTRVYSLPQAATEFFADRTGNIFFHQAKKGLTVNITYMGGGSRISASNWNEMVDSITSTQNLITDLSSLIFGNIRLRVTPSTITTTAALLNTKLSGQHIVTFDISLTNVSNQVYTWLNTIPLYVTLSTTFLDADIADPVISPATKVFTNGVCQVTALYQTDYGTYKKYTSGDYVSYTFTTVDPNTLIGINLTTTVINSIQ